MTLVALGSTQGCSEPYERPRLLTDEPVVIGISLSVVEDGPHASDVASLPADRPRAEVLPLDTVELDALVADADGPRDLADAAWVLCGGLGSGCLASLELQGERYGVLEPCTETSAATAFACEAGRGVRPRTVLPAFDADEPGFPPTPGAEAFQRAAVVTGSPGGPTTEACLQQLLIGPRSDLRGCAIGVTALVYGPPWEIEPLLEELGFVVSGELPELPELVTQLLPPNAAPRIEQVRVGLREDFVFGQPDDHLEARSIHEPIEVEAGTVATIEPIIPQRDQQLVLDRSGPDAWIGRTETVVYDLWADAPIASSVRDEYVQWHEQFPVHVPDDEGPIHIYVLVTDSREGVSWFTLELEVIAR